MNHSIRLSQSSPLGWNVLTSVLTFITTDTNLKPHLKEEKTPHIYSLHTSHNNSKLKASLFACVFTLVEIAH